MARELEATRLICLAVCFPASAVPPCCSLHPFHPFPRMANDLEASKAAAVKSVSELQARLAAEHKQMLKLQVCDGAGA